MHGVSAGSWEQAVRRLGSLPAVSRVGTRVSLVLVVAPGQLCLQALASSTGVPVRVREDGERRAVHHPGGCSGCGSEHAHPNPKSPGPPHTLAPPRSWPSEQVAVYYL